MTPPHKEPAPATSPPVVEAFIARWSAASASERANAQLFLAELCEVLGVPRPDPDAAHGYAFEFPVTQAHPDGSSTEGRIDLYKRACFVLEAKQFQTAQPEPSELQLAVEDANDPARRRRGDESPTSLAAQSEPPHVGSYRGKKRKSGPTRGTEAWDDAMLKARGQAERYVRALPASEPNPPFLLVVDVGHSIEVFADFTQAGRNYLHFPHPRAFRILLADLRRPDIRERLRLIWTDPLALDPARHSAAVTCEVSDLLAQLAKSLEKAGHAPRLVADFLCRCLFCMFAEDAGLLPAGGFTGLLDSVRADPAQFQPLGAQLFREMNTGTAGRISVVLRHALKRFNGGLFADATALDLDADQIASLRAAGRLDWKAVEPAIFGTLLQRALDPAERHKLGAEFTPRAYVERLVLAAVIEPLRAEWAHVRAAAYTQARAGRIAAAIAEIRAFHRQLCALRILDPACGSGNFLYVTFELLKRLELEILDELAQLGDRELALEIEQFTVHPRQFFGLEINPRAAALAELVLWIGYLQWQARAAGSAAIGEPVLQKLDNLQCRDAVLAWDGEPQPVTWAMARENPDLPGLPDGVRAEVRRQRADRDRGKSGLRRQAQRDAALAGAGSDDPEEKAPSPLRSAGALHNEVITLWDRRSMKTDPVTGREVPDETQRVPLLRYPNARPAEWPAADYIVGNPPFLGKGRMREDLGDGYAETLRAVYPEVPESADFVMYWWHKVAALVRAGWARRFGLITTNSISQTFNRRVVQMHLLGGPASAGQASEESGRAAHSEARLAEAGTPNLNRCVVQGHLAGGPRAVPARSDSDKTDAVENLAASASSEPLRPGTGRGPLLPLSLLFAIADHPWVDTAEGAAVRIAMTVGAAGEHPGELLEVTGEQTQADGWAKVTLVSKRGRINGDLTVGTAVTSAAPLKANDSLASTGLILGGRGFVLSEAEAEDFRKRNPKTARLIFPLRNGEDINGKPRNVMVIDTSGWDEAELRSEVPEIYQRLRDTVYPERQTNRDPMLRKHWWLFRRTNEQVRAAIVGLRRFIVTVETSKYRTFTFLPAGTKPEHKLVVIGSDDAYVLGVLSNRIHVVYALAAGSWLGVGNDPVYAKSRCFDPFPFPACSEPQQSRIRALAEELDAHRKRVQAQHPGLTLTGLYNVLEKLRAADIARPVPPQPVMTPKEKQIHDQGLVSVLKQLHDDLDAAVAAAYGWPWALSDEEILTRLVALNAERAAEEARGVIRWLRPEYQNRGQASEVRGQKEQAALDLAEQPRKGKARQSKIENRKSAWPKPLAARVQAVEVALRGAGQPVSPAALAKTFTRAQAADVAEILETLETLGRAHRNADGLFAP